MSSSPSQALPVQPVAFAGIFRLYAALADTAPFDRDLGLGGKLLYAGKIDAQNRLQTAASIAGAASLAASTDPEVLRQAMRDGAIDFLVTSLEEALRILKNEVRKRNPIAVAVSESPERIVSQMQYRGVLPDLLPPATWDAAMTGMNESAETCFHAWGSLTVGESARFDGEFATWTPDRKAPSWLARMDEIAFSIIPESDLLRRRWLRLAPRYLGRPALQRRGVLLNTAEIERFRERVESLVAQQVAAGEESVSIRIDVHP